MRRGWACPKAAGRNCFFKLSISLFCIVFFSASAVAEPRQTPLQKTLDCSRYLLLPQKAPDYRALFSPESIMGTCGPTCAVNIATAAEVAAGKPASSLVAKMKLAKRLMQRMYGKDADVGTSRVQMAEFGTELFKELGLGKVESRSYFDDGWHSGSYITDPRRPSDVLNELKENEIALIGVEQHWIVVTGYDPALKRVYFLDPNLPNLSPEKGYLELDESGRFCRVKNDIFHELYKDIDPNGFGKAERAFYIGMIVTFSFQKAKSQGEVVDSSARE